LSDCGKCGNVWPVPTFAPSKLLVARLAKGLSRPELALAAGVSDETIRRAEHGHKVPRPGTVAALAAALDVDTMSLYVERAA
jgi:transcriptional regulator with XRE-family HTH domain